MDFNNYFISSYAFDFKGDFFYRMDKDYSLIMNKRQVYDKLTNLLIEVQCRVETCDITGQTETCVKRYPDRPVIFHEQ